MIFLFCINWQQAVAQDKIISSFDLLKTSKAPISNITIINIFPHDSKSFTQGLVYHQGYLYESTGLNGKSVLKKMEIKSGRVINRINLSEQYFGEGMAILNDKIYQLTWLNQTCLVYDLLSFRETGKLFYSGEGWGLTTDGEFLIMSNGTSDIIYLNPQTFKEVHKIYVKDGDIPVTKLNELEFVRGEIWANIFQEDVIARISPQTGKVIGWIDLGQLNAILPRSERRDALNGIAYDPEGNRLFITGKFWPKLFEIKVQNQKQH
ncbi:MAG: glutamine cyclotransferase [Deltaproteobacteria bacterium HGW-Deltaproteobacteria-10]|nr:MAG: glutamine cyclotransferase [Deltaproteobacteria bacterium HGW-Deltaproteobacteria-10]